jgi:hypothetical protein
MDIFIKPAELPVPTLLDYVEQKRRNYERFAPIKKDTA